MAMIINGTIKPKRAKQYAVICRAVLIKGTSVRKVQYQSLRLGGTSKTS